MSTTRLFLISLIVLLCDQASKILAEIFLSSLSTLAIIRGFFHLTLVHNKGAAFGFLKGGTYLFIIVTFFFLIAIISLLKNKQLFFKIFGLDSHDRTVRFALGLIFGGACGNLMDRLRFSYVIDFLDFRVWPVFNLADSAITIGGLLIFYKMLKKTPHKEIEHRSI